MSPVIERVLIFSIAARPPIAAMLFSINLVSGLRRRDVCPGENDDDGCDALDENSHDADYAPPHPGTRKLDYSCPVT